jgi:hypothetical protein
MLCSVLSPIRKNNLNNTAIAIKTDWSGSLGMGHIQRMTALLWHLNNKKNITAALVCGRLPEFFPEKLIPFTVKKIGAKTDLIIRDMRDSSSEEITELRKTCPVLVIDDNGPGRDSADYRIDLLPNPVYGNSAAVDFFIYGYNFLSPLQKIREGNIVRDIDFSIYRGNAGSDEHEKFILSLLPAESKIAVLGGKNAIIHEKGREYILNDRSYPEIILSSKVIISHFGITLYEGKISGCKTVSVNPGPYHNVLSEMAKDKLNLLNLGEAGKIDVESARLKLSGLIRDADDESIKADDVYHAAMDNLENFFAYINSKLKI